MKKEITANVRLARDFKLELENNIQLVLRPYLFRTVPVSDKIAYLKTLAEARSALWETVYRDFPEARGKSVQIKGDDIEWDEIEPTL